MISCPLLTSAAARGGLIIFFAAILSVAAGQHSTGTDLSRKPNIVFILADDLGYYDLSCYGNPYNNTPHIDYLANRGMKFTNAYAASPVCSPSRAAILTGRHPARLKLTNFLVGDKIDSSSAVLPAAWKPELSGDEVTLAELLKHEGYATGVIGKWHLGWSDSSKASSQGFMYDRIIGRNGLDYYNYSITADNKEIFADDGDEYLTDKLTDYADEFLDSNHEKPFFLFMSYSAPHVLLVPRADKLRKYLFAYNQADNKYNPYYAAMLESMDDGVGRILNKLKSLGVDDNTIVIFTSDNGGVGLPELGPTPTSMKPLRAWKGHVYEGGIRVPLIVKWPGKIPAGTTNANYLTGTDYLPTFMEILGKKVNHTIDGKSFLNSLYNPGQVFDRGPVFWHYPHFSNQEGRPAGAMRWKNFKLVENYETGQLSLYNLENDPGETQDLAGTLSETKNDFNTIFNRWKKEVGANMPVPNPAYRKPSR